MASTGAKKRRRLTGAAALVCALVASLAVAVAPAAAEGDSAPIRPFSEGGVSFPDIQGPAAPEEYPFQYGPMSPEMTLRQVSDQVIVAEYPEDGGEAFAIKAEAAHAADGATVPTSIRLSEDGEGFVITLIVHHRAGNPAAGGAPFAYPISGGPGWEGGYSVRGFEINEPAPATPAVPSPCTVPALHGLSLKAVKARLRSAHCSIGQVHLAAGATAGNGRVVRQFHAAGTELGSGAPVAVKLGPR